jgi:hypothetical protein
VCKLGELPAHIAAQQAQQGWRRGQGCRWQRQEQHGGVASLSKPEVMLASKAVSMHTDGWCKCCGGTGVSGKNQDGHSAAAAESGKKYATKSVKVFGLSFPCLELYTLANLLVETIKLACYTSQQLTPAMAGKQPKDLSAHQQHVRFAAQDDPIQEHPNNSKHWVHLTLIIPGGINIE